jgi:hypothetical protein
VDGDPASSDPLRLTARYVVEANRRFRVAWGAWATERTFPPVYRSLQPAEYDALFRRVEAAGLLNERTRPAAQAASEAASRPAGLVIYDVAVTARGRTRFFRVRPEDSPATADLLRELVALGPEGEAGSVLGPPAARPAAGEAKRRGGKAGRRGSEQAP